MAPNSASFALRIDQGINGHGLLSYVNTTSSNKVVFAAASLAAGGLNVMGDGNVGIGTGTPAFTLDVNGTANFAGAVRGNSFIGNGMGLTNLNAASLTNGIRVQQNETSPNIGNGFSGNSVGVGVVAATIAGGGQGDLINTVNGSYGTVGGGASNTASTTFATVAGGGSNTASGYYSFAAGYKANANHDGCFVWGDYTGVATATPCGAANQFVARASGGVVFYTKSDLSSGVQVAAGGNSWSMVSDRSVKEHFAAVDTRQVLARVAQLPVLTWNYKSQDAGIRHIGPMAQDFYAAFEVGEDDRHITEVDEGGVALAAIQGLNQRLEEAQEQIRRQQAQIQGLKKLVCQSQPNAELCK